MRQTLHLHRDSHCKAVTRIEVEVTRPRPDVLALHYFVTGDIGNVRWPAQALPVRSDGLWQNTCFEVFALAPPSAAYFEYNFAPSLQWAAYRFDGYRQGMREAPLSRDPQIGTRSEAARFELSCEVAVDLPDDSAWRLGLSAVIEETGGAKSYWALAHPNGRADFHHSDCFALELPAPLRA